MTKITINANIPTLTQPTLMHYELCFLNVTQKCPDDRQSSCSSFTVAATSYIRVTEILNYAWKQHPLTKEIPVALPFHDSFILLLGYSVIYPGYPKYCIGYV